MIGQIRYGFCRKLKDIRTNISIYQLNNADLQSVLSITDKQNPSFLPDISAKLSNIFLQTKVNAVTRSRINSKKLKMLIYIANYPYKLQISKAITKYCRLQNYQDKRQMLNLCSCIEMINFGSYLQKSSYDNGYLEEQNRVTKYILEQVIGRQRLVIVGDYYHTKACYLSTQFDHIQIPNGLSIIEEQISVQQINSSGGHDSSSIEQLVQQKRDFLYEIVFNELAIQYGICFQLIEILNGQQDQSKMDQVFRVGINLGYAVYFAKVGRRTSFYDIGLFQQSFNVWDQQKVESIAQKLSHYYFEMAVELYPYENSQQFRDQFHNVVYI